MLSYRVEGIDNGFRLGTSLPHEFSSNLEDVINRIFGSFMALPPVYSTYYKVRINEETFKIQKTSLVVEKATNGFFISTDTVHIGFTYDVDAIKYLCSKLLDIDATNVSVEVLERNARLQSSTKPESVQESVVSEEPVLESEDSSHMETVRSGLAFDIASDLDESEMQAHKRVVATSRSELASRPPTKLVSILDGNPNYYPRPWDKDAPLQPLEKRKLRMSTSTIPERDPIEKTIDETIMHEELPKPDKKTSEFVEKVATIVNDLDVSATQPLSKEEEKAIKKATCEPMVPVDSGPRAANAV